MSNRPTPPCPRPAARPVLPRPDTPGRYTSTTMANVFGLNQMFGQGRTGVGQTIAIVEFEQYAAS